MSSQTVIYETRKRLSCSPCNSDVIVCVDTELTANGSGLILGNLYKVTSGQNDCHGNAVYQHWIQYEGDQLEDPGTPLTNCDIDSAFCSGCLVKYIDWTALHPVIGGYTFTYPTEAPEVGQYLAVGTLDEDALTGTLVWTDAP